MHAGIEPQAFVASNAGGEVGVRNVMIGLIQQLLAFMLLSPHAHGRHHLNFEPAATSPDHEASTQYGAFSAESRHGDR